MLAISLLQQKSNFSPVSLTGYYSYWLIKGTNLINSVTMPTITDKKIHSYTQWWTVCGFPATGSSHAFMTPTPEFIIQLAVGQYWPGVWQMTFWR